MPTLKKLGKNLLVIVRRRIKKKESFEYKKYSHYNIIQYYITDFVRKSMEKVGEISPTPNSQRYTNFVDIFT